MRDEHLQSPDFFDAQQHPEMRFASRALRPAGDGSKVVVADKVEIVLDIEAFLDA